MPAWCAPWNGTTWSGAPVVGDAGAAPPAPAPAPTSGPGAGAEQAATRDGQPSGHRASDRRGERRQRLGERVDRVGELLDLALGQVGVGHESVAGAVPVEQRLELREAGGQGLGEPGSVSLTTGVSTSKDFRAPSTLAWKS